MIKYNKEILIIIRGFFLGSFIFLTLFLLLNIFIPKIINIGTINIVLMISLLIGQLVLKQKMRNIYFYFLFLIVTSLIFLLIFKYINGYSVDGNAYHLEGIIALLGGKSIFFDNFTTFWLDYYPKNIEILFSSFVNPFVNYDFGRFFKFLLISATLYNITELFFSNKTLFFKKNDFKNNILIILISLIVVLNPVVIYQFFTLYIDDVLYLFILNIFYYLIKKDYLLVFIIFSILSGSKFTYIFYSLVLFLIFFVSTKFIFKKDFNIKFKMNFRNISILLSGFLIGFHQYIINLIKTGNPFYLFLGEGKVDVFSGFFPKYFSELNNVEKFISAFSTNSVSGCYAKDCWLQIDLLSIEGIKLFFNSYKHLLIDPLGNGFGNIFYVLLLLSLFLLILFVVKSLITKKINKKEKTVIFVIIMFIFVISVIPLPWARYYPFIYILPLLSLFLLKNKFKFIKIILIGLYIINFIFISLVFLKFNFSIAHNKHREISWVHKDLSNIKNIYYFPQYKGTYGHLKLINTYNFNKEHFFIGDNMQSILNMCELNKKPNEQITYCKNGIFIYPNYGSFLGEYMFLEYKQK